MLQRCRASAAGGLARSISKDGERSSRVPEGQLLHRTVARHGEGANVGHVLLDWRVNGVEYVRAPTGTRLRTSPSSGALWVL